MATVTVIGGGYVGLVTAACFAEIGHEVRCLEADEGKVLLLRSGTLPISEPGLEELWSEHSSSGRLSVTGNPAEALQDSEFIFIAVGTPESADGSADLRFVDGAVDTALAYSDRSRTLCIKSTVPPGTTARIQERLHDDAPGWTVVSNPEFLSQGRAVRDFMEPDRVVIGSSEPAVSAEVAKLYSPLGAPTLVVDSTAAELVKYTSNSFLALKISFINEISHLCEVTGTDVGQVATGVGLDSRIGPRFLEAGIGWGGSCFPKDTAALEHVMQTSGVDSRIVSAARDVNADQVGHIVDRIEQLVPEAPRRSVAVLGLAFKDGTDDLRGSQSIPLIRELHSRGYHVKAYDPVVSDLDSETGRKVTVCSSALDAFFGSSAAVIATAWPELISFDYSEVWNLMRDRVIVDARRCLDPDLMRSLGFTYYRPGDGRDQQMSEVEAAVAAA